MAFLTRPTSQGHSQSAHPRLVAWLVPAGIVNLAQLIDHKQVQHKQVLHIIANVDSFDNLAVEQALLAQSARHTVRLTPSLDRQTHNTSSDVQNSSLPAAAHQLTRRLRIVEVAFSSTVTPSFSSTIRSCFTLGTKYSLRDGCLVAETGYGIVYLYMAGVRTQAHEQSMAHCCACR